MMTHVHMPGTVHVPIILALLHYALVRYSLLRLCVRARDRDKRASLRILQQDCEMLLTAGPTNKQVLCQTN
jgi:hypothetical protein